MPRIVILVILGAILFMSGLVTLSALETFERKAVSCCVGLELICDGCDRFAFIVRDVELVLLCSDCAGERLYESNLFHG